MGIREHLTALHKLLSVKQLVALTGQRIFLPFYHTISNRPLPHIKHLYATRNVQAFEDDLDYLCQHFEPVNINRLQELALGSAKPAKPVMHLSFDDGLKEIYTVVAPILERRGIPASFYINSAFVDNADLFYRYKASLVLDSLKQRNYPQAERLMGTQRGNGAALYQAILSINYTQQDKLGALAQITEIDFAHFLEQEQPYLTRSQIADLHNRGFTIGAHSVDHPRFKHISDTQRKVQLAESLTFLQQHLGIAPRYFAFPFSDEGVDKAFFDWMYHQQGCQLSFGTSGLKHDVNRRHLHRVAFEGTTRSAHQLVKSEYLSFFLKSFLGKNKIKRS